jgi:DNA-binding NarL/FixJ family response regulator
MIFPLWHARRWAQALELLQKNTADVVLMDIRCPVWVGLMPLARFASPTRYPIIMLTTFNNDDYIVKAIKAGANGTCSRIFPKTIWRSDPLGTIRGYRSFL